MSPLRPLALVKALTLSLALSLALTLGCSTNEVIGMRFPALAAAMITPHSVTMAVGQTQQVTVVPYDTAGVPFAEGTAITFSSSDTNVARVDVNGLVTAKAVGSSTITGSVRSTSENLGYSDQTTVTVVATPATAASLEIATSLPTVGAGSFVSLSATVRNAGGTPITGVGAPFYVSSDRKIGAFSFGSLLGVTPGQVQIIGTITVFGTTLVDTTVLTVTNPTTAIVTIRQNTDPSGVVLNPGQFVFIPSPVTIAPGGRVQWRNSTNIGTTPRVSMNVTFDDPTAVTGGNIPPFNTSALQTRTFPTAGTYTYRSTTNGATGTVIVQ